MLRKFIKNKAGQNTAEYALLIALVVGGIIAMQEYAGRALKARVRDASTFMVAGTNALGNTYQYEPDTEKREQSVNKESEEYKRLGVGTVAADSSTNVTRNGTTTSKYDTTTTVGSGPVVNGL